MERTTLLARHAKSVIVVAFALVMFLALGLGLSGGAYAASDYDGDGAIDDDCMPYDPAFAPGRPDKPDLQFEDTNCDGIDGDKGKAIFVSGTIGDDAAPGTLEQPMKTINAAVSKAAPEGKDAYIEGGTYEERVQLGYTHNVSLYGGYTLSSGERSTLEVTEIKGSPEAVVVSGARGLVLQQLTLTGERLQDPKFPGDKNVYGLRAINVSDVALEGVTATAGPAWDGANGSTYAPPRRADNGGNGGQARFFDGSINCYDGGGPGYVGYGTYGLIGALQYDNPGGFGGHGGDRGMDGSAGREGGGGSLGGSGGDGGTTSNQLGDFLNGKDGEDGATGAPGNDGSNATFTTANANNDWVGGVATPGAQGDTGGGGGGGGGGAGRAVGWIPPFGDPVYWVGGGGGGSGGSSGWGGLGGTEGKSGGGSFGIYIENSAVAANASSISSDNGGAGGDGGQGSAGGEGGLGGIGAPAPSEECLLTGGTGGDGGDGGRGGAGGDGGAGAGGPSAAVFVGGGSLYALRDSTTQFGSPGAGGLRGGVGPQAQSGVAAAALSTPGTASTPSIALDFDRDGVRDLNDACLTTPGTRADGCGQDTTPPVVSITSGPDNGAITASRTVDFSFRTNETASFSCKLDGAASFEPCSSPKRYTDLGDGQHAFSVKAKDVSGNESTPLVRTWTVDATPPEITVPSDTTAEATGSNGAAVNYIAGARDTISGSIAPDCSPPSGSTFGLGTTAVGCSAEDAAGNSANASFNVTVQDKTPPKIIVPPDITQKATSLSGTTVSYNPTPTATDIVDGDLGSEKVSCDHASGSTFPLGTTTVTCTATDGHNNTGTATFEVNVDYGFGNGSGGSFGEPVRDTELNRMSAGAGVPVKFGLGGNFGLDIFAAGYPVSKKIDCTTGLPEDDVEVTTVSKSGLTYDATSNLYTYVWKTDKAWKGTCRELNLKLADGNNHPVQFRFT